MLEHYDATFLQNHLLADDAFRPFPDIDKRDRWTGIAAYDGDALIAGGEKWLGFAWPALPAARYLDFTLNGNRTKYEATYFERRNALWDLVVAECVENQGRFVDSIVNGIWATCEETNWVFPAHNNATIGMHALPKFDDYVVDLFAGETAAYLAYIAGMLGPRLDAMSPLIRERIYHELHYQVFDRYMAHDDYWWLGFDRSRDHVINNWNPWINSNVLTAAVATPMDRELRVKILAKAIRSIDVYLAAQTDDGGCDEGPSYWSVAGGALFQGLETLYLATDGALSVYGNEKIKRIASYIYRVHINDNWYVNFADAAAKAYPNPYLVRRVGQRIHDPKMTAFGEAARRRYGDDRDRIGRLWAPALWLLKYEESAPLDASDDAQALTSSWFEDIQVALGRSASSTSKGIFVAAKGGHNNESHNHNDLGQVIVYVDGQPALIDAGVGDYTRFTFSDRRYEIWTMQSAYHNLPTVNGVMQKEGADHHATNVTYNDDGTRLTFSLGLERAYPPSAGIAKLDRSVVLDRPHDRVVIRDEFALAREDAPMAWNFMTRSRPQPAEDGFRLPGNVRITTESGVTAEIEHIEFSDQRLLDPWGTELFRITLTETETRESGVRTFTVGNEAEEVS